MADLERDQQAFMELREKLQKYRQMLGKIDDSERRTRMEIHMSALTGSELSALPDDTSVYKAAGKAYLLSTKARVEQELASHVKTLQDEVQKMTSQRARTEREMMEAENEIRELLKTSPELASKLATLAA